MDSESVGDGAMEDSVPTVEPVGVETARLSGRQCALDFCDRSSRSGGSLLCEGHYSQQWRGKPLTPLRKRAPGKGRGQTRSDTYTAVHQRLYKARGRAAEHQCKCGAQAAQWSYHGPREPGETEPFSTNLDDYKPMCVPCHKTHDNQYAEAPKGEEHWNWKGGISRTYKRRIKSA